MSVKSKGRALGRMIRRVTGLPLPTCMRIGKLVAQCTPEFHIMQKFPGVITSREAGCECCSHNIYSVKGPKGTLECEYGLWEDRITKEYNITMRLRSVPMGTAVSVEP